MDTLIISSENKILHISNCGYTVDYTIYDSKGHNLDGGVLESSKDKFKTDIVIKEILEMIKDQHQFTEPYMYLKDERADGLLELIQMEDYKYSQSRVREYLNSFEEDKFNENEKERI